MGGICVLFFSFSFEIRSLASNEKYFFEVEGEEISFSFALSMESRGCKGERLLKGLRGNSAVRRLMGRRGRYESRKDCISCRVGLDC